MNAKALSPNRLAFKSINFALRAINQDFTSLKTLQMTDVTIGVLNVGVMILKGLNHEPIQYKQSRGCVVKYHLTTQQLEEMVLCIVDCDLKQGEALEYMREFCLSCLAEDAEEVMV